MVVIAAVVIIEEVVVVAASALKTDVMRVLAAVAVVKAPQRTHFTRDPYILRS